MCKTRVEIHLGDERTLDTSTTIVPVDSSTLPAIQWPEVIDENVIFLMHAIYCCFKSIDIVFLNVYFTQQKTVKQNGKVKY